MINQNNQEKQNITNNRNVNIKLVFHKIYYIFFLV